MQFQEDARLVHAPLLPFEQRSQGEAGLLSRVPRARLTPLHTDSYQERDTSPVFPRLSHLPIEISPDIPNARLISLHTDSYQERDTPPELPKLFNLPIKKTPAMPITAPLPNPIKKTPAIPITAPLPNPTIAYHDLSKSSHITESLPSPTFAHHELSKSSRITGSLAGLHKHWMSERQQHIYMSLVFFAVGFSAITALATAVIGLLPLDIAAYVLVWPSLVVWLVLGVLYPRYGKLALKGFLIGMLACFFYDCMRFAAIALGLWGDFIPKIAMMLLHTNKPDWVIGYIWRYVGDGGFMSTTFVVGYYLLKLKLDVRIAALAFGIAIWLCLIGTILLAPDGTTTLFPLTPITLGLSLLGHVIYGLSIGFLYNVFIAKKAPTKLRQTNPNRGGLVKVA